MFRTIYIPVYIFNDKSLFNLKSKFLFPNHITKESLYESSEIPLSDLIACKLNYVTQHARDAWAFQSGDSIQEAICLANQHSWYKHATKYLVVKMNVDASSLYSDKMSETNLVHDWNPKSRNFIIINGEKKFNSFKRNVVIKPDNIVDVIDVNNCGELRNISLFILKNPDYRNAVKSKTFRDKITCPDFLKRLEENKLSQEEWKELSLDMIEDKMKCSVFEPLNVKIKESSIESLSRIQKLLEDAIENIKLSGAEMEGSRIILDIIKNNSSNPQLCLHKVQMSAAESLDFIEQRKEMNQYRFFNSLRTFVENKIYHIPDYDNKIIQAYKDILNMNEVTELEKLLYSLYADISKSNESSFRNM